MPILPPVETPDLFDFDDPGQAEADAPRQPPPERAPSPQLRPSGAIWGYGARVAWVAGLILMLSSFMSWYAGKSIEGPTLAVIGWHTGTIGKLVFFVGLAVLVIVALRETGFELPPSIPESLLVLALGALATVFVVIRIISIPDSVLPADGRGIGIWISLVAALGVIAGGLLTAAEEL